VTRAADELSHRTDAAVRDARCVLFLYHEIGYACAEALLAMNAPIAAAFTHCDTPGEEIWWRSCAELARANSIPIYTPKKIGPGEIAQVAALQPAIIYSFYYRNMLPAELLDLAPLGAYNLHGSLLPKYRGRAPVNWILANGESEAGATLHHMVARADAGDIVAQRAVPISDEDTALTLYRKIVPIGASLIREYHPLIASGTAPRRPQDLALGSYFGRRTPADGQIDWNWPARRIFNLVRAVTHPYPGAFAFIDGRKLYVWTVKIGAEEGALAAPGTIVADHADGAIEVAAGAGSVILTRVQLEGDVEAAPRQVLEALRLSAAASPIASAATPRTIRFD
jgi:methionyl-tRNA formyltransferase